jgi:hypothetical protein
MFSQIATSTIFKYLLIMAISSIKFLFAPLLSFEIGFSFIQTWITTTIGGLSGVLFFFFLSKGIISVYQRYFATSVLRLIHQINTYVRQRKLIPRPKKRIFTYRNKSLVKIRRRYGLLGIIILTPVLLSIPLGTFLAIKYYPEQKNLLTYLSLSVIFWSFLMSSAMTIF